MHERLGQLKGPCFFVKHSHGILTSQFNYRINSGSQRQRSIERAALSRKITQCIYYFLLLFFPRSQMAAVPSQNM